MSRTAYLLIASVLVLLSMVRLYYVGEEAIFPITSQEMWQHGLWLKQVLYGLDMQHNPLFNWLIISFASLIGWTHVLEISRLITVSATIGTSVALGWLTLQLFQNRTFALFSALSYLTFLDVLFYHGWLAYVDPLFGFFIFFSIAALWIGCLTKHGKYFWIATFALTCALLTKAFTAYVFYCVALLVLAMQQSHRQAMRSLHFMLAHFAMLLAPILWFSLLPKGGSQSGRMFDEITAKLHLENAGEYVFKLLSFPLEIWFGLLPVSGIALLYWLRRHSHPDQSNPEHLRTALWIAGLNFLPYWLAPHGGVRYLIPIYPLFALIFARIVWLQGPRAQLIAQRWMAASILLAFAAGLGLYPYYQHRFRGENYAQAAADIVSRTQGQPLYTSDVSASGLNVSAYVNKLRFPAQALQFPPVDLKEGYTLAREPLPAYGQISKTYQLLGDQLYLMCKGNACSERSSVPQP